MENILVSSNNIISRSLVEHLKKAFNRLDWKINLIDVDNFINN